MSSMFFCNGSVHESVSNDSFDNVDSEDLIVAFFRISLDLTSYYQITSDKTVKTHTKSDPMNADVDMPSEQSGLNKQGQQHQSIENNKTAATLPMLKSRRMQEKLSLEQEFLKLFLIWILLFF